MAEAWIGEGRTPAEALPSRSAISVIAAWRLHTRLESRSRLIGRVNRLRLARSLAGG